MAVIPGDLVVYQFTTRHPTTGAATDADSLPTGVLVLNGVDTAVTVTIANVETGVYTFSVTVPSTYDAGDEVQVRVAATVNSILDKEPVWSTTLVSAAVVAASASSTDLYASAVEVKIGRAHV